MYPVFRVAPQAVGVPTPGYAGYIGRVGALAVALGVGVAVATGQGFGVAHADTDTSSAGDAPSADTSSTDTSTTDKSGTPETGMPPADSGEPPGSAASTQPDPVGSTGTPSSTSTTTEVAPGVVISSSGGAHDSADADPAGDRPAPSTADPTGPTAATPAIDTTSPTPPEEVVPQSDTDPPAATPAAAAPPPDTQRDSSYSTVRAEGSPTRSVAVPAADQTTVVTTLSGADKSTNIVTGGLQTAALTARQPAPDAAKESPGMPESVQTQDTTTNGSISLLVAVLSPFAAPGPDTPVESPVLWAVLAWARRETSRNFADANRVAEPQATTLALDTGEPAASSSAAATNSAPVAVNNSATTKEDTPVSINVLANDTDGDGDTLTPTVATPPANGTTTVTPNGWITYTPNANFNGTDTFTYTASDGTATSSPATVTVKVTAVNDAPIARPDTAATTEDTSVVINVKANDFDPDDTAVTPTVINYPDHGKVVRNTNGTFTYTPKANFTGTDTFTYRLYDGSATSAPATVTITVNPVNDIPVAVSNSATTKEDTPVLINVLANDTDGDGDTLTPTVATPPANGTTTVTPNGWITYTPNANFNGTDTFTYTASDGTATSSPATVTVKVTAVNDAPIARPDTATTLPNTPVVINVKANDFDPDDAVVTPTVVNAPANGKVVRNANGTFTYTPKANFTGTDTFTYRLYDGSATSAPATVTVTVNTPPVARNDTASANEGGSTIISVLANDTDANGNSTINPTTVIVTQPTNGIATANADGTVTYQSNGAEGVNADSFTYTVKDTAGATSNTATVTVAITPTNDAPVAGDDTASTPEDTPVTIGVLSNDSDPESTTLTVISTTPPTNGSVVINPDRTITYTPAANFNGADTFTYTVSDGNLSDTASVTVTIAAVHDDPAVVAALPINGELEAVHYSPDRTHAVVITDHAGPTQSVGQRISVVVVDTATGAAVAAPLTFDGNTDAVIFNPTGTRALITFTDGPDQNVAIINTTTGTNLATIPLPAPISGDPILSTNGTHAAFLTVDEPPDGSLATTHLTTINLTTGSAAAALPINGELEAVHYSPDRTHAVVITDHAGPTQSVGQRISVVVVDTATGAAVAAPLTFDGNTDAVIFNPTGTRALITFTDGPDQNVAIINTTTGTNLATIPLPAPISGDPILSTNGTHAAFLTVDEPPDGSLATTHLTTINLTTGSAAAALPINGELEAVHYSPDRTHAVVITDHAGPTQSVGQRISVVVVDTATGAAVAAPLTFDGNTDAVIFNPTGTRALITFTDGPDQNVAIINTTTGTNLATIPLPAPISGDPILSTNGTHAAFLTVDEPPDGSLATTHLTTINLTTGSAAAALPINGELEAVHYSPDRTHAVVITDHAGPTQSVGQRISVVVVDTATGAAVAAPLTFDGNTDAVIFNPTGTRALITFTDGPDQNVAIINTTTGTNLATIPLPAPISGDPILSTNGTHAAFLTVDEPPDGSLATTHLTTINLTTGSAAAALPINGELEAVHYSPDRTHAVVITDHAGPTQSVGQRISVVVVDTATGAAVAAPLTFDGNTDAVIFNPTGTRALITFTDGPDQNVAIINTTTGTNLATIPLPAPISGDPILSTNGTHAAFLTVDEPPDGSLATTHLTTINLTTGSAAAALPINGELEAVHYSPDRTHAVVITDHAGPTQSVGQRISVVVVDTATGAAVAAPLTFDGNTDAVIFNPTGTRALITFTDGPDQNVAIINTTTGTNLATIPLPAPISGDPILSTNGTHAAFLTVDEPPDGSLATTHLTTIFLGDDDASPMTLSESLALTATPMSARSAPAAVKLVPNFAPIALPDVYSTNEDTARTVAGRGVLANDLDLNGDALTAALVAGPNNGSVILSPNGSFTYTPNANFNGRDSFTYRASDGITTSNVGTVFINVAAVNDAPVAAPDTYTTPKNTKLTVPASAGVLANDTDPDGPVKRAQLVARPSNGTLILKPDGSFTYTPAATFNGTDTFTYRASDGKTTSAPTTVSIKVNTAPVARNDTATVNEGATTTISVLANDTDADGNATINPTSVIVTQPANGTATANPNGTVTYASNGAEVAADSFTYTVKDATGAVSNTATVNVTVTPVNDAPIAVNDTYATDRGVALTVAGPGVLANDTDPDSPALTAQLVTGPSKASAFTLNPDGSFSYTPAQTFSGTDSFTYTADDNFTDSTVATVTITVGDDNPGNDPPVADENEPFTISDVDTSTGIVTGTVNVTDPDLGDTLGYRLTAPPDPALGTVVVDATTGAWTFTPTGQARLNAFVAAAEPTGVARLAAHTGTGPAQVSFTISANDGAAATTVPVIAPIDGAEAAPTDTAVLPGHPIAVAVHGDRAYVLDGEAGLVRVIDTTTMTAIDTTAFTPQIDGIDVGQGARDLVASPDGTRLYVTHPDGVVEVNTTTFNTVGFTSLPTLDTEGFGPHAIAITPDGQRLFVTDFVFDGAAVGQVWVIDTETMELIDTNPGSAQPDSITVPARAADIEISPDGDTLYVLHTATIGTPATVTIIDTTDYQIDDSIDLGPDAFDTTLNDDGTRLYVSSFHTRTITVINTDTHQIIDVIDGLDNVAELDVHGDRLYATSRGPDGIIIIDTTTGEVIDRIGDLHNPTDITTRGNHIYLTVFAGSQFTNLTDITTTHTTANGEPVAGGFAIDEVDTRSGVVTGRAIVDDPDATDTLGYGLLSGPDPDLGSVSVDATTGAFTFTPTGVARLAAHTGTGPAQVSFTISANDGAAATTVPVIAPIDGAEAAPTDTAVLPGHPIAVAVHGDRAYVLDGEAGLVRVIDTTTMTAIDTTAFTPQIDGIDVGQGARDLVASPDGTRLYVTHPDGVVEVNTTTFNTVGFTSLPTLDTEGFGPHAIAITPDGQRLFVTDFVFDGAAVGQVWVIDTETMELIDTNPGSAQPDSITVPARAADIEISPDGDTLYVLHTATIGTPATVTIIDTTDYQIDDSIDLGPDAFDTTLNDDGTRLYVSSFHTRTITVINTDTHQIIDVIDGLDNVAELDVHGDRLYATSRGPDGIIIIDTTTGEVIDRIGDLHNPTDITTRGNHIYLTVFAGNQFTNLTDITTTHTTANGEATVTET